jgi:DNA-binding transcriptional LysR family regulator
MIELRHLHAFVLVAEEGHVTRAAERLGMRQPPLTRLLQGLEARLGCRLLHRLPRGVVPTEAGLALLDEARAVLARATVVEEAVRRAARGEAGRLAIGFTSSAALHPFVSTAIRRFREASPMVRVELDEAGTAELVEGVQLCRLDAAFVRSPVGAVAGLRVEPVLDEPMLAALPEGHRLAADDGPPPAARGVRGGGFRALLPAVRARSLRLHPGGLPRGRVLAERRAGGPSLACDAEPGRGRPWRFRGARLNAQAGRGGGRVSGAGGRPRASCPNPACSPQDRRERHLGTVCRRHRTACCRAARSNGLNAQL